MESDLEIVTQEEIGHFLKCLVFDSLIFGASDVLDEDIGIQIKSLLNYALNSAHYLLVCKILLLQAVLFHDRLYTEPSQNFKNS